MADDPRLISFRAAVERLEEALCLPQSPVVRDSGIKRFELCFELSWKVIQSFLRDRGLDCRSPRDCFREAFSYGLITNEEVWLQMISDRNLSVHTYNEALADQMHSRLAQYLPALSHLLEQLQPSENTL
ncbi:MAG: Nucleotidyltransferase substrate binding protein like [Chloroflexi bacterium]|jgi:nucleotidyltransferase substrate binding protein (TIGR01987 family)|nr:MAG: Nucleotidyltransferase substrate binding protein like [Chloroflexota bacterium]